MFRKMLKWLGIAIAMVALAVTLAYFFAPGWLPDWFGEGKTPAQLAESPKDKPANDATTTPATKPETTTVKEEVDEVIEVEDTPEATTAKDAPATVTTTTDAVKPVAPQGPESYFVGYTMKDGKWVSEDCSREYKALETSIGRKCTRKTPEEVIATPPTTDTALEGLRKGQVENSTAIGAVLESQRKLGTQVAANTTAIGEISKNQAKTATVLDGLVKGQAANTSAIAELQPKSPQNEGWGWWWLPIIGGALLASAWFFRERLTVLLVKFRDRKVAA